MMIQKDKETRKFVWYCDECPEELETGETDFNDARLKALDEGWRSVFVNYEWRHYCPEHRGIGR
jgi:hypothetical protein